MTGAGDVQRSGIATRESQPGEAQLGKHIAAALFAKI
jgi:hypothetical protein